MLSMVEEPVPRLVLDEPYDEEIIGMLADEEIMSMLADEEIMGMLADDEEILGMLPDELDGALEPQDNWVNEKFDLYGEKDSKIAERVPGVVFEPYDYEIISILADKLDGALKPQEEVKEFDLYGEKEPWLIFDRNSKQNFYAFTKLKMKNESMFKRTAGRGTWVTQKTEHVYDRGRRCHIGFKKLLTFSEGKKGSDAARSSSRAALPNGHWIMHEFSCFNQKLGEGSYVLCKIRNKDMDAATKGARSS